MGLDGEAFLSTGDPVERLSYAVLAARSLKVREREHEALATAIVNKLGEALKQKR